MVRAVGHQVLAGLEFVGDSVVLLFRALAYPLRGRIGFSRTVQQMAIVGTDSLPIAAVTLFFVGLAWGWNTAGTMLGATSYYGGTTALAIARELAPALCSVVVAARVGSAFAAELGTMTVTEQVDALRALAVNPVYYLVVPRLTACIVMLPILTIVAIASGFLGALTMALHFGVSAVEYMSSVQRMLGNDDFFGGIAKTLVFGLIIAIVGCRQGLRATGGAAGVGRATISAVVLSIVLIYITNLLLTAAIFGK